MKTSLYYLQIILVICLFETGCRQNQNHSSFSTSEQNKAETFYEESVYNNTAEPIPGYAEFNSVDTVNFGSFRAIVTADHSGTIDGFIANVVLAKNGKVLQKINDTLIGTYSYSELVDFSNDGYPDLVVHTHARGSGNFDLSRFYKLSDLTYKIIPAQMDADSPAFDKYERGEEFYTEGGKLLLEFQLFNDSDAGCCPTTGLMRIIEYKYENENLVPAAFRDFPDTAAFSIELNEDNPEE